MGGRLFFPATLWFHSSPVEVVSQWIRAHARGGDRRVRLHRRAELADGRFHKSPVGLAARRQVGLRFVWPRRRAG